MSRVGWFLARRGGRPPAPCLNAAGANAIIKTAIKYDSTDAVAADLRTIKIYDLAESKAFFGTADQHGPVYDLVKAASDFWKAKGDTSADTNVSEAVDPVVPRGGPVAVPEAGPRTCST